MIATKLFAALAPLFDGRVYPGTVPFDTPKPYITYVQVGGEDPSFIDGALHNKEHARMQLNLWHEDDELARNLIRQVRNTLVQATTMTARPIGAYIDRNEPDLGLFGKQQDFSIWAEV